MIPAFPVYIFDVDGTLVDSADDICGALVDVFKTTSCRGLRRQDLTRYIGIHLVDMLRDLMPEAPPERCDELIREYRRLYLDRDHRSTRRYPGVKEALAALPGRKSTATTKGTPTTRQVLERFDLIEHFDHVQGTDGFAHKPAPDVVLAAIRGLGARPEECLMVGDSQADMEAGRRAGVKVCAVTYGYGNHTEMARWTPDYWISDLRELCQPHALLV
ncbi:MAG: HAD family hydrolase [Acidobacteriota bacterium]